MEDKIIRNNEFTSIEELKKAEEYYKQALYVTKEEMDFAQKPSKKVINLLQYQIFNPN